MTFPKHPAKPGELSVERVTPYEVVVSMKTAREIGVRVRRLLLLDGNEPIVIVGKIELAALAGIRASHQYQ
jgi:hypothetical protein